MALVIFEQQVRVPLGLTGLADFRRWALSDEFPNTGRIDYIEGDIEVDMSPEDLFSHGTLKGKIYATLLARVEQLDLGHLFPDSTRVSNVEANLSVEPDIVLISHLAIEAGQVRLVPKASAAADRYVEIEGAPDLVVEIVSDSSVKKDSLRLPDGYYKAGVTEYWLVDGRGAEPNFQIHRRGRTSYSAAGVAEDGFQRSDVMDCWFRLRRTRSSRGYWQYELESHS